MNTNLSIEFIKENCQTISDLNNRVAEQNLMAREVRSDTHGLPRAGNKQLNTAPLAVFSTSVLEDHLFLPQKHLFRLVALRQSMGLFLLYNWRKFKTKF